jgi:hypothetical protein
MTEATDAIKALHVSLQIEMCRALFARTDLPIGDPRAMLAAG